jgi:hypothetical protein
MEADVKPLHLLEETEENHKNWSLHLDPLPRVPMTQPECVVIACFGICCYSVLQITKNQHLQEKMPASWLYGNEPGQRNC